MDNVVALPLPVLTIVRRLHDDGSGVRKVREDRPAYPALVYPDGRIAPISWAEFHAKHQVKRDVSIASQGGLLYLAYMSTLHQQKTRLRAVLYLRLSVMGDDESTSFEKSERDLRARCASEGWDVVAVLKDDGLSGGIRRAKADECLRMLREGDADVLMVWKFDRWSRQGVVAAGDLMETLMKTAPRTRFIALQDGLDSAQQFFPMMAAMVSEFARIERENIRLRVRTTVEYLASQGRYYGGQTAFGWTPVQRPDGPGFIQGLNPEQYPTLREIIDRVIAGEAPHAICLDLNERGAPSPEGNGWYANTMRQLLRNPILRGMSVRHANWAKREFNLVLGEDGVPIRPNMAAVTDDEWDALQTALDARSRTSPAKTKGGHLLKGLAVCNFCGKNLAASTTSLRCSRHRRDLLCPGCVIDRTKTEAVVTEEFLARYGDARIMVEVEVEQDTRRVREIMEGLDTVGRRLRDADSQEEERKWLDMKWSLRAELKALETVVSAGPSLIYQQTGTTYAEEWAKATVDERRRLLATHIYEVRVTKATTRKAYDAERVTIVWLEEMNTAMEESA